MKKKVAFYLNNPTLPECDYSSITSNPQLSSSASFLRLNVLSSLN